MLLVVPLPARAVLEHGRPAAYRAPEKNETDPDQLDQFFRLDHLATRMRRNAESLIVLSGSEPVQRRQPGQSAREAAVPVASRGSPCASAPRI